MASKENKILGLFFNYPKQWHFEELLREAKIGRPQLARWLKTFQQQGIIKRVKTIGMMPYYIHNFGSPAFANTKKIFAYETLAESGLLNHLASLEEAKAVTIFGSMIREDWYADSDIDIFIYGSDEQFDKGRYELVLGREIEVHNARNHNELRKMKKLLPYITTGHYIKGTVANLGVKMHA